MKTISSNERLIFSVVLGYVVILNLIGSSYLEFYPIEFLIGAAFGVGIAMIVGSLVFFLKEPKLIRSILPHDIPTHYARRVTFAARA